MARRPVIGVMGPGAGATPANLSHAVELGRLIAAEGWVVLCGGRADGVMDAVCHGAKAEGGLTIGILPGDDAADASGAVDVAIVTGMGSARNNINVLSSDAVVACGMGAGTASEVALALKAEKPVVLLGVGPEAESFFSTMVGFLVHRAATPQDAMATLKEVMRA